MKYFLYFIDDFKNAEYILCYTQCFNVVITLYHNNILSFIGSIILSYSSCLLHTKIYEDLVKNKEIKLFGNL